MVRSISLMLAVILAGSAIAEARTVAVAPVIDGHVSVTSRSFLNTTANTPPVRSPLIESRHDDVWDFVRSGAATPNFFDSHTIQRFWNKRVSLISASDFLTSLRRVDPSMPASVIVSLIPNVGVTAAAVSVFDDPSLDQPFAASGRVGARVDPRRGADRDPPSIPPAAGVFGAYVVALDEPFVSVTASRDGLGAVVPEPAVLVFLLFGLPAVWRRAARRA